MLKQIVVVLILTIFSCHSLDIYENCGESINCAENNLINVVNEFDSKPSVSLIGDYLTVEKTNEEAFLAKSEEGIFERLVRYIANHEIKLRLPSSQTGRSLTEESRKKKLRRMILPILLLLKLKALIIIPAILFVIALIAVKGAGAGIMALIISLGVALKAILEKHGGPSTLSYEIVPQIPTTHWNRNGADAWAGLMQGYQTVP